MNGGVSLRRSEPKKIYAHLLQIIERVALAKNVDGQRRGEEPFSEGIVLHPTYPRLYCRSLVSDPAIQAETYAVKAASYCVGFRENLDREGAHRR